MKKQYLFISLLTLLVSGNLFSENRPDFWFLPFSLVGENPLCFVTGPNTHLSRDFGFKLLTTVSINDVTLNEGTGGSTTPFNFTVTRSDNSETFSLTMNTSNGTATVADNDYVAISGGTISFTAGGSLTATVTVTVNHDHKVEANETFTLDLSGAPAGVVFSDASGLGIINNDEVDYGDVFDFGAPFFSTTLANNGARHNTVFDFRLGATVDGDSDGQPDFNATGDDTDADGDDEDGLVLPVLVKGATANIAVTASAAGFLNAWVDFEANASWDDAGNQVFTDFPLLAGVNNISFDVPVAASSTSFSFARFRFSSAGGLSHTGSAADGEVEDYFTSIIENLFSIDNPSQVEGDAGASNLVFTLSRSNNSIASSVDYAITGGTATSGTDYVPLASGTINFAAGGALSQTVTVTVNGDLVVENNETAIITLSNPVNGSIGAANPGTGTITNDDAAVVTLSGGVSQNEGTSFVFTATLNNPVQGGFSVAYTTNNGTATTADNDYTDNDGSLSFTGTAGEAKTFTVVSTADNKVELNETFTVALGAITAAPAGVTAAGSPQTGTIQNDDAATVAIAANVSQLESTTPQAFSVTISNPVDVPVMVQFSTSDGTATTADNDYTGIASQAVTFPAGTTTAQTVNVTIVNDTKVEANEVYNTSIGTLAASGRNVSLGTSARTGTITNDDAATVTLSGGSAANEGNTGTTSRSFTATLNNPVQGGFTVAYSTNDGTATTADNDYVDNDGPALSFSGTFGEAKTITVLINGDFKVEANETITVALGAITGAPAGVTTAGSPQTGTINNDEVDWGDGPDSLPTVSFYNGARHNTILGFQLGAAIDGDPDGQGTGGSPSNLANGDDTDADGDDEDGVTLPGVFVRGTTASITVNASQAGKLDAFMDFDWNRQLNNAGEKIFNNVSLVAGDNVLTFNVPAGAVVGSSFLRFRFSSAGGLSSAGVAADGEVEDYRTQIVNNQFSIDNPSVAEGIAGTVDLVYTVTRTSNNTASSVDYAITGGTATSGGDYVPLAAGTVNFTAGGALTQTLTVTVNGDFVVEDHETVIITLSNPVNGGIGANPGTGTITNDDNTTITFTGGGLASESTLNRTVQLSLSAPVQGGFTIAYTTVDGTALVSDSDYNGANSTLNFAGTVPDFKTITILGNNDVKVELDETYNVTLGAITNTTAVQAAAITVNGSPQTITIQNDDAATVAIAANVSQAEATSPQAFSITLSNPVDVPVTVQFATSDGTATTADNDYNGIASQMVTFPAGTTSAQTANVTINNDTKVEANEDYNVSIGTLGASGRNVSLGTTARTGTITNDDNAVVTLSGGIAQNEGNAGTTAYTFTATLNNAVQGGFTANYTTNDGTATTANNDYVDNDGSLTFTGTAGETKTFTVLVNGDLNIEANETFQTAINSLTGVVNPGAVTIAGSPQTATITNDEQDWGDAPTSAQSGFAGSYPTLATNNGARHAASPGGLSLGNTLDADLDGQPNATASGDGADEDGVTLPAVLVLNTSANITVNASAAGNLNAWVDFNRDGDWNDAGEQVFTNTALAAGNNTLSFAVPAGGSTGGSFARFRLSTAAGTTVDGLAADGEVEDYALNIVNTQFSISDPSVAEGNAGNTNLGFVVTRTVNVNNCSVDYAITGGTATTADGDYQVLAAGTVNFTAGGPLTQTVNVVVNGDVKVELDETVDMTLSNAVNGSILDGSGTGTITNDDAASISISSPVLNEGDGGTTNATFTLTMSNPSDANVVLNFASQDGSATIANNDYQNTSGSHTFTPGQVTKQVDVPVVGDCSIESNETFILRLGSLVNNGRNVSLSGGGATLDGTATITNDDALPVITCPANLSKNVDPGVCNTSVTLTLPTNSSICGSSTLEFRYRTVDAANNPTGPYNAYAPSANNTVLFDRGKYEVEWRISDGSGNSVCSFYLTIVDNQAPAITCPANATVNANASCQGTVGSYSAATLSDNCNASPSVTQSPASSTLLTGHNAAQTVTLTANDGNGNTANCTLTVTLKDMTPPGITCPANATVNANASCQGTVGSYAAATLSDNCNPSPTVTQSPAASTTLSGHNATQTVTLTANDGNGNTSTCTLTVTLKDVTKPNITCPANVTINVNASCQGTLAAYTPTVLSDNCNPTPTLAQSPVAGTIFSGHNSVRTVTLTATDVAGNTQTCTLTVTLKDVTPPAIVCRPFTANLDATGNVSITPPNVYQSGSDNCGVVNLVSVVASSFNCSNVGNNLVTLTANDGNGNTATCSATVTVRDVTPPVAKCRNVTANLGPNGTVTVSAAAVNNGSTDNCSMTFTLTPNTFNCSQIGLQTVTLTATDPGGNMSACTARITVRDITGPTAKCINPTIFLNDLGQATLSVAQVDNGSTDNCGIGSRSISKTSFNCSEIGGTNPVTLSLTDVNGNSASCLAYVTVRDAIAPTAVCEDVTVALGANGTVVVYGADLAANSTDNCSVWSYSPTAKVYKTANLGANNLTITVKDWSGNASTCVSVVTVILPGNSDFQQGGGDDKGGIIGNFDFILFPNPTSGEATMAFELPAEQTFSFRIFDTSGRMIYSREDIGFEGENIIPLHMDDLAPGVYMLDFQSKNLKVQKRLVLQR
jgi:hypothetical protein